MSEQLGNEIENSTKSAEKEAKKGINAIKKASKNAKKTADRARRFIGFLAANPVVLIILIIVLFLLIGGLWLEQTLSCGTDANFYITALNDEDRIPKKEDMDETIDSMEPSKEQLSELLTIIAEKRFEEKEKIYQKIRTHAISKLQSREADTTRLEKGVELTMANLLDNTDSAYIDMGSESSSSVLNGQKSKSAQDVINGAVAWAKAIAADNSFHYGCDSGSMHKYAHSNGCYFCKTNSHKKNSGIKEYEKTYCCNPFVHAAFAHGGGEPTMLKKCKKGSSYGFKVDGGYSKSKLFKNLGHISKSKLQPGDVICKDTHVMLYIGNNQIVEATTTDNNKPNSNGWNNSIKVKTLTSKRYAKFPRVHRYIGKGGGTMEIPGNSESDTTADYYGSGYQINQQDLDVLSAYTVSIGNSALKAPKENDNENNAKGILTNEYTDMKGNPISLYWWGKKRGQINYKKDLKKKFSIFNKDKVKFYEYNDGELATTTIKNEDGSKETVYYLKIEIANRDISEIAKDTFGVEPDAEYGTGETGKVTTTNMQAIATLSETTEKTLFEDGILSTDAAMCLVGGKYKNPLGKAKYTMTSPFGWRIHPIYHTRKFHSGIDMAAPTGTPVYASYEGKVITAGFTGGYGNLVEIKNGKYIFKYAHLSKILVTKGATVETGQLIGKVGSTGDSTGPHLHFEVTINGKAVDPQGILKKKE